MFQMKTVWVSFEMTPTQIFHVRFPPQCRHSCKPGRARGWFICATLGLRWAFDCHGSWAMSDLMMAKWWLSHSTSQPLFSCWTHPLVCSELQQLLWSQRQALLAWQPGNEHTCLGKKCDFKIGAHTDMIFIDFLFVTLVQDLAMECGSETCKLRTAIVSE